MGQLDRPRRGRDRIAEVDVQPEPHDSDRDASVHRDAHTRVERVLADRPRDRRVGQDAAIKLGSVASETLGVSSRAMIEALIAGERDPQVLADLAKGRLRGKIGDLVSLVRAVQYRLAVPRLYE